MRPFILEKPENLLLLTTFVLNFAFHLSTKLQARDWTVSTNRGAFQLCSFSSLHIPAFLSGGNAAISAYPRQFSAFTTTNHFAPAKRRVS